MRIALGVIVVIWLVGSAYYSINGFKTRKTALAQLKEEREGNFVPPSIKAEPILPKSLEERARAIAEAEARGEYALPPDVEPSTAGDALADAPTPTDAPDSPPAPDSPESPGSPDVTEPTGAGTVAPPPPPPVQPETPVSIFDAPAPSAAADASSLGRATVAEVLQGVSLPCDLVPLVAAGAEELDPRKIPFITRGFPASTVAVELRDALVAAGFTVQPTGPMSAAATGPSGSIDMLVHEHPSAIYDGNMRRFPSAQLDSVVVELSTR